MEFTGLVALGTLVFALVNFLKYTRAAIYPDGVAGERAAGRMKGLNGMLTQVIAWSAGIGGVFLASTTGFAQDITIGTHTLGSMSGWTKVFFGLIATSLLTTFNEAKKALDNTDSARTPSLLHLPAETQQPTRSAALTGTSDDVAESKRRVALDEDTWLVVVGKTN
jgi:hypothetical protein